MNTCHVPVEVMLERSIRVKDAVVDVLHRHPAAKGNYSLLLFYVWRDHYDVSVRFDQFERLLRAPSPETIARRYREVVEVERARVLADSAYVPLSIPSGATVNKRVVREDLFRRMYGSGLANIEWYESDEREKENQKEEG